VAVGRTNAETTSTAVTCTDLCSCSNEETGEAFDNVDTTENDSCDDETSDEQDDDSEEDEDDE